MYNVPVTLLSQHLSSSQCVDPYLREQGGTCTLDTDGDKIADHEDMCPYEYGENCRPKEPLVSKCPQETDSTWKLFWRDAEHGDTLYTRCPRGVYVSAGTYACMFVQYKRADPGLLGRGGHVH